jgi:hypothetical protein
MKRGNLVKYLVFAWLSVSVLAPGDALAQCNWQATAAAGVTAYNGGVVSDHFGQLTRVDCINSRSLILRAKTFQNSTQVWSHDEVGGPAALGNSIVYSLGFPSCSGYWTSSTRFGATFLGIKSWFASDTSGLAQAYCYDGGGGGGIDPGPCSAGTLETTTWSLAGTSKPVQSTEQTGYGLWRSVDRPEGSFLMDEWAVVSWNGEEPRLKFSSTEEFKERVRQNIGSYRPQGRNSDMVLVIEANDHPRNRRFIPTPLFQPFEIAIDWPQRSGAEEFWFRAEVAEAGGVDRMMLLESSDAHGISIVREALKDNLRLEYADPRRHRLVVFGRAEVSRNGRLRVQDALVVLPQCCCGTDEVFCI